MDIVEIVWAAVAAAGLASSGVMLWFVNKQRKAMKGVLNGKRRQLNKNIRTEIGRGLIHIINILIGIGALLDREPVKSANGAWILVATSSIIMINTFLDARMAWQDYYGTEQVDYAAQQEQRDEARDEGRDLIRDPARDTARDLEHDGATD